MHAICQFYTSSREGTKQQPQNKRNKDGEDIGASGAKTAQRSGKTAFAAYLFF